MWKPKSREEREMGPELGEGVLQTVEGLVEEERKKKSVGTVLLEIVVLCFGLGIGFLAAFLVAGLHGVRLGFYAWPFIVCADVFALTTIGFFSTDGKTEKIYGVCSVVSLASVIVQSAVLF